MIINFYDKSPIDSYFYRPTEHMVLECSGDMLHFYGLFSKFRSESKENDVFANISFTNIHRTMTKIVEKGERKVRTSYAIQ